MQDLQMQNSLVCNGVVLEYFKFAVMEMKWWCNEWAMVAAERSEIVPVSFASSQAVSKFRKTEEHQPKRMKLFHKASFYSRMVDCCIH